MDELSFDEWQKTVPVWMKSDPLWESGYYRMAMYLYDVAWQDYDLLKKDYRDREIVSQLVRSAGGIGANVEEAYGRGVGSADYIRVIRIALGEAREARGWYFRSRHVLPDDLLVYRAALTGQLIAMRAGVISAHRKNLSKP